MLKELYLVFTVVMFPNHKIDSDAQFMASTPMSADDCRAAGLMVMDTYWAGRGAQLLQTGCSKVTVNVPDDATPVLPDSIAPQVPQDHPDLDKLLEQLAPLAPKSNS